MNKATTLALAGLMGMSVGAYATEARDAGLGAASQFIVDDAAFTTLPQEVLTYKGATYFELGTNATVAYNDTYGYDDGSLSNEDRVWGGTNIPVGPGALGVWVNRANWDFQPLYNNTQLNTNEAGFSNAFKNQFGYGYTLGTIAYYQNQDNPTNRVDLIYAFDLTDAANLAIGVNRFNNDWKNENGPGAGYNSFDDSNLGLTLGSDIKNLGFLKILQIGLQVNTESISADANNGSDNKFDSSATGFQIRVGGQTGNDEGGFSRIELGFKDGGLSVKSEPNGLKNYTDTGNGMGYNIGYAVGMSKDKGLGLVGIELLGTSSDDDNTGYDTTAKNTNYTVDLLLSTAAEYKVKEWLTLRAGLSGSLFSANGGTYDNLANSSYSGSPNYGAGMDPQNYVSNYSGDGVATDNSGSVEASVGASFNIGDITLDGVVNQNILYTGTYLVSGESNALFGMISGTWKWSE